ncbi:MAG TPA: glycoside hydrolase family 88 protein [Ramlibacter sp.]|uniref:glycoside hydrolase family 88 protein n=1 Tax=Ramlibacter sp. TaxID=1917967 RepID=UPI002C97AC95|nr:glycoside hydrolase family 88 protein [Ramlibacter sp.]HVZ43534.1 glycoside hydrolase family 88 protein [Ramlibacter sp.]
MTFDRLPELAARAADYICAQNPLRYENWENACNAGGLVSLDAARYADKVKEIADYAVRMQASDGQLAYGLIVPGDPANVVEKWTGAGTITGTVHAATLGPVVLRQYEVSGESRYLDAAKLQFAYMMRVGRTRDGGIVHREEAPELWLDTVWFVAPFLAKYGLVTGNGDAVDDAVRQIDVHVEHLLDPKSHLLRHIWCETPDHIPQSMYWARGHGWVVAAVADIWEMLPAEHRGRASISRLLGTLLPALVKLQDRTGLWRNIMDDKRSPLEASGTLMFAYGIRKALDLGIVQGAGYADAARRAMEAVMPFVGTDGAVSLVALPPGGPRARLGVAPYGQGWFAAAAGRFLASAR